MNLQTEFTNERRKVFENVRDVAIHLLEKEKQQIIEAFEKSNLGSKKQGGYEVYYKKSGEQYYNETFKQ